ncbi:MAG: pyruvate kinase [Treponema sp.]|nr:pyruvate kinase [Treponema sp.]MBD5412436.1 pyruvate kinase [Treponema sp.]MBD5414598.1 pyruvate kinase [Treponema sp.]MDE6245844.1 pyruvate kinase [Treponemataceae bacterium]
MFTRKTKIVCSIGPACDNDGTIRSMIKAGMNIARFNFSHGSYEWHAQAMQRVRRISDELNMPVGILLDTKGPEIRTGIVENDGKISIKENEKIEVISDSSPCTQGTESKMCHISISWKEAAQKLQPGMKILIADGLIALLVDEISGETILCTAQNSGEIGSRKNVNLIGVHAGLPIMAQKDKDDLKFGAEMDIDFVAASFVSFPEEVVEIKAYLKEVGANARVIAKIENEEGLNNIHNIVKEADGIMVARGDLGVQLPTERIPLAQKAIIRACRDAGKPVITATQMLDSMIINPRPTRAELTDVSNAVFDGTDAVMLSGETASGKYPVEAVSTMALITRTTEESDEYLSRMKYLDNDYKPDNEVGHTVAHSAYRLSRNLGAKAIIIPTLHGNTARIIGSYRPEQIVIAATPEKKVCRQLMIQWGISPILCQVADDSETMIQNAVKHALDSGAIKLSDKVVMCAGIPLSSPLMINTIRVMLVGNVIARGTLFGFANEEKKKASGRVIYEEDARQIREKLKSHSHLILVCSRITEDLIPVIRIVDGVASESGSDIPPEVLKLVNHDLVWALNVPNAEKVLENDLSVTIDGEQGVIYEGIV